MRTDTRTPVIVVSGFLGSGKTTLLKKVLATPELSNSMLIVNEIGEIGIDHQLLERSDDNTVLLDNGCMCCQLRGDLQALLVDLGMRRYRGELPSFDRVIIETSGLAEPGPIAQTLYGDGPLARDYRLAHVVTLIDPINTQARQAAQAIADAQIAAADLIVLSKSDLATPAQADAAWAWARAINSYASGITAVRGDLDIALLADATPFNHPAFLADPGDGLFGDIAALRQAGTPGEPPRDDSSLPDGTGAYLARQRSIHPAGIANFALRFDTPLNRGLFDLFMSTLLQLRGQDLLRVKGIVYFEGERQAQLIQGVCHVYDRPVALERDPGGDRQSTLVFIARNLAREQIEGYWQSLQALAE
ncbi:GTP-binding protein [Pusillimonas sp. SM2304]|uniref:CobW family GTP-binding protein n=1 Tax=Pusillimonas sp. SM2304 TaxID=3073241 RepID=UPI002875854C|nr:GTP-binding protein [Pusillimonas sp. SM2304]MDS1142021.1 GTP-binding protein [Pusillimonas sp. SM2304]